MLDLDSDLWGTLHHAYGPADDVPSMLRELRSNPGDDVWEAIWSSLCHQGSVSSASYAAVPHIVAMSQEAPVERQIDYWNFVWCVAAQGSTLEGAIPDELRNDYYEALQQAAELIRRRLESRPESQTEVIYLLATLTAAKGCRIEAHVLDWLAGNELPGKCPGCSIDLRALVEPDGVFLGLDNKQRLSTPLINASGGIQSKSVAARLDRETVSEWLPMMAAAAGHPSLATTIMTLYGRASCPECGAQFPLLEEFGRQLSDYYC